MNSGALALLKCRAPGSQGEVEIVSQGSMLTPPHPYVRIMQESQGSKEIWK